MIWWRVVHVLSLSLRLYDRSHEDDAQRLFLVSWYCALPFAPLIMLLLGIARGTQLLHEVLAPAKVEPCENSHCMYRLVDYIINRWLSLRTSCLPCIIPSQSIIAQKHDQWNTLIMPKPEFEETIMTDTSSSMRRFSMYGHCIVDVKHSNL